MKHALILKRGREKSLKRRHPWIFSGAIERVAGQPASGDTVEVRSAEGAVLGLAAFSPDSQISARVWSFEPGAAIDAAFFKARIAQAIARRDGLAAAKHTNALRLIHGESDGLPGLVVDRYADVLVAQFLSAGAERWREAILDAALSSSWSTSPRSSPLVWRERSLPPEFRRFLRAVRNVRVMERD
jgi:23S rRNA (cytosine1962-C5)-methyltransferase